MNKNKHFCKGLLIKSFFLLVCFFIFVPTVKAEIIVDYLDETRYASTAFKTTLNDRWVIIDTTELDHLATTTFNFYSNQVCTLKVDIYELTNLSSIIASYNIPLQNNADQNVSIDFNLNVSSYTYLGLDLTSLNCVATHKIYSTSFRYISPIYYKTNNIAWWSSFDDGKPYMAYPLKAKIEGTYTVDCPECETCDPCTVYPNDYPVEINQLADISVTQSKSYVYSGTSTEPIETIYKYEYTAWRQYLLILSWVVTIVIIFYLFIIFFGYAKKK